MLNNSDTQCTTELEIELELELNLESEPKCVCPIFEAPSSPLSATVLGEAAIGIDLHVKEEKQKQTKREVEGDVEVLLLDNVSVSHPSLSLNGLAMEEDSGSGRDGQSSNSSDGVGVGMDVNGMERKITMINSDSIGCYHVTSLNDGDPPLPVDMLYEVEKEIEVWEQIPQGSHHSDAHSGCIPSNTLRSQSLKGCEDHYMAGEENNGQSKNNSPRSPNDHSSNEYKISHNDNHVHKNEKKDFENDDDKRRNYEDSTNVDVNGNRRVLTKDVASDFSTPYQSKQQVLMWKSWGKDIDWSKMKFEGNSEIYTKAQETLSRNGGKVLRNVRKAG